jgi:hypothetical protein
MTKVGPQVKLPPERWGPLNKDYQRRGHSGTGLSGETTLDPWLPHGWFPTLLF